MMVHTEQAIDLKLQQLPGMMEMLAYKSGREIPARASSEMRRQQIIRTDLIRHRRRDSQLSTGYLRQQDMDAEDQASLCTDP